ARSGIRRGRGKARTAVAAGPWSLLATRLLGAFGLHFSQDRNMLGNMQRSKVLRPLTEIVAVSALLTSYIWGWEGSFEGAFTLCVLIYAAIGLAAHFRAREGPFDIGIRLDNLAAAGRDALLATAVIGLLLVGTGLLLGSLDFPPLRLWFG